MVIKYSKLFNEKVKLCHYSFITFHILIFLGKNGADGETPPFHECDYGNWVTHSWYFFVDRDYKSQGFSYSCNVVNKDTFNCDIFGKSGTAPGSGSDGGSGGLGGKPGLVKIIALDNSFNVPTSLNNGNSIGSPHIHIHFTIRKIKSIFQVRLELQEKEDHLDHPLLVEVTYS